MNFRDPDATHLDDTFPIPLDRPFTTEAAVRSGLSLELLTDLHHRKLLTRPLRRVHVNAVVEDSLDLRVQSLALVMPPDGVVVDRHAGWLHGAERSWRRASTSLCGRSRSFVPRITDESGTRWPTAASAI